MHFRFPYVVGFKAFFQIGAFFSFFFLFIYLFIYFWLCWVFVAVSGLFLVAASGGYSSLWCTGFSLLWLLLLQTMGSRCNVFSSCGTRASVAVARRLQRAGSVVVAHGLSCSVACGIFPDQGSNPCSLHWQVDSQPLCHQGSPGAFSLILLITLWKFYHTVGMKYCTLLYITTYI